ncbi:MAG TPA: gliding motility-associated ABC transporter substrate-binding protein GldG [Bacteroidales bacterium]|nr:gliding motility-associated ABC transporter substrate-binding protein GldG [Bacteroidales bacterium]HRT89611.1 gliding motility-associated ABC transporter substrate-binding protein GldG [Bacteroidales bacterium]
MEENKLDNTDRKGLRLRSWSQFLLVCFFVFLAAAAGSVVRFRLDLTEDNRYSLSKPTREILRNLHDDIFIQVYLDGEMPVLFKKLKRSVREMLDEFSLASNRRVDYQFINPYSQDDPALRQKEQEQLIAKGLSPVNVIIREKDGGSSRKMIYPGMLINYNNIEVPVNFLKNNPSLSPEENLLHSAEGLEYELIRTISTLVSDTVYRVAFIEGHGEVPEIEVADFIMSLAKFYTVDRGNPQGKPGILDKYAAVIVAGPKEKIDEPDLYVIDRYIMNGGRVLWLCEEVEVNADSLVYGETVALYKPTGLEEMLFKYGVRINPVVVQDLDCMLIPLKAVSGGAAQQVVPAPWIYYPLLHPSPDHPVTRNVNRVAGKFVNYIDTVGRDTGVKKHILLTTGNQCRTVSPPVAINLKEIDRLPDMELFNRQHLPVAVLLEGKFRSAFTNRYIPGLTENNPEKNKTESKPTAMIVIADRDIIRNEVSRSGKTEIPLPLGQDRYTLQVYGNRDFLLNCVNYLVDDKGLINLRARELKLRLLDKKKLSRYGTLIKVANTAGPVLIVIMAGIIFNILRRKKYSR